MSPGDTGQRPAAYTVGADSMGIPTQGSRYTQLLIHGTALISVMGVASILPVLPDMGKAFALSEAELGILVFSFTLPGIFLAPVGGILADRIGRKAVLLPCLLIFALGGLMASLADSLSSFVAWRVFQGCGAACLGVLYNTIIGDIFPDDAARLRVMGLAATTLSLGAALYPALGGVLGEWGWRWPLRLSLLALPLAAAGLLAPLPALPGRSPMAEYARQAKATICSRRSLAHFGITLCAFCILYGPMITYFPLYADTRFAASPATIGILFALSSLGTALASGFLGRLALRCPPRVLVMSGALCFALSMFAMLALAPHWLSLWLLTLPVLFYGLGQGLAYPTVMTSLSSLVRPEERGVLMAVNGMVLRLAQSLAPLLCGAAFAVQAFAGVYAFGLCLALCMLWLGSRLFRH